MVIGVLCVLIEAGDCGGVGDVTVGVFGCFSVPSSFGFGIATVGFDSALGEPFFCTGFSSGFDSVFGIAEDFCSCGAALGSAVASTF